MIRRLLILDLALISLLTFGIVKFRRDWRAFDPAHQVSAIQPSAEKLPALPASAASATSPADWTEIPTLNPFSFDRNDIAILAPPPEPPKAVGPKPLLFGTMTLGQASVAMLASGVQPNNRNSRPVHVGETIDGWTVVEIQEKSVLIEANSTREKVDINDGIPRDYTRTLAPATAPVVQNVGSSSSSASVSGAPPAPNTGAGASSSPARGGAPCVRELKTPFGIVRQPCD